MTTMVACILRPQFQLAAILVASFVGGTVGCSASTSLGPEPNPPGSVLIGGPCNALKNRESEMGPVALFVEIARVQIEAPIPERLATSTVVAAQIAGVQLEPGEPARAPWRTCLDQRCTTEREATLTLRILGLPTDPSVPLSLEVKVESGSEPPQLANVRTRNQESALVNLSRSPAGETFIITPYYLFAPKQKSMETLMQCRAAQNSALH